VQGSLPVQVAASDTLPKAKVDIMMAIIAIVFMNISYVVLDEWRGFSYSPAPPCLLFNFPSNSH
jgi:hypothetical protein